MLSRSNDLVIAPNAVPVSIEQLAPNVRRINSSCLVDSAMEDVWAILTDYNGLSDHVPNLVVSRVVPHPNPLGIRIFQEGAQKIVGFEFRASLTMDMTEVRQVAPDHEEFLAVAFELVESRMFQEFHGEWRLRRHQPDEADVGPTELSYTVTIKPRGVVPVAALEWRIREDVPTNMLGIKAAAEARTGAWELAEAAGGSRPADRP